MMLLCLHICCHPLSGRKDERKEVSASLDLLHLLDEGRLSMSIRYSFHESWSMEGRTSLPVLQKHEADPDKKEHDSGLSWKQSPATDPVMEYPEYGIGMTYWPKEHMNGPYLTLRCTCGIGMGADMVSGAGYAITIRNGLGIETGFEIHVLSIAGNGTRRKRHMNFGIFYRF